VIGACGIHDPGSLGVSRYVARLRSALADHSVDYLPSRRSEPGRVSHLHLANSSRLPVLQAALRRPYLVTVHDVVPRDRRLVPFQRAVVYPLVVRRAEIVVVHSQFAAELLGREAGPLPRVELVAHPATPIVTNGARANGKPLAVLPGVLKGAKLVNRVLEAATPLLAAGELDLLLCGRADSGVRRAASAAHARLLDSPDEPDYRAAIASADFVLCLRDGSVGETNGPLLDGIGAGKPIVATRSGSIPEAAAGAALYAEPTVESIRESLHRLATDGALRDTLRGAAVRRREELTWDASARRHAELIGELAGA
jgi:glycosyltransferase involved in cell wall biosynthesis